MPLVKVNYFHWKPLTHIWKKKMNLMGSYLNVFIFKYFTCASITLERSTTLKEQICDTTVWLSWMRIVLYLPSTQRVGLYKKTIIFSVVLSPQDFEEPRKDQSKRCSLHNPISSTTEKLNSSSWWKPFLQLFSQMLFPSLSINNALGMRSLQILCWQNMNTYHWRSGT